MKEAYWTETTLSAKARQMLAETGVASARSRVFMPDLKHAALLVLDMQRYFLSPDSHAFVPSGPAIVPGIVRLIRLFLGHGRPVVLTRHLNDPADAGMMKVWWDDLIRPGQPESEVLPELRLDGARVMEKRQYDAFHETGLARHLRAHQVHQVVITGVMTHLCCETTARSAFVQGFNVFFPVDGTATYHELYHRSSLINLSHGFATPITVDGLLEKLEMP